MIVYSNTMLIIQRIKFEPQVSYLRYRYPLTLAVHCGPLSNALQISLPTIYGILVVNCWTIDFNSNCSVEINLDMIDIP